MRARLGRCLDDVRSALAWTLSSEGDAPLGIRLTVAALPLWGGLSLVGECRVNARSALARLDTLPMPDQRLRAHLLFGVAMGSTYLPEDADGLRRAWDSALRAARAIDDSDLLSEVLSGLVRSELLAGRHTDALEHALELRVLAKRLNCGWARDEGDFLLAMGEIYQARLPRARARIEQLVERQARHPVAPRRRMQQVAPRLGLASAYSSVLWLTGAPARAAAVADATVCEARETAHRQSMCQILVTGIAATALWNGHIDRASRYAAELARLVVQYQLAIWRPASLCIDVLVACGAGIQIEADDLVAASEAMLALPPALVRPIYLVMIADELAKRGHIVEARLPIRGARAKLEASQGERWPMPELLRVEAALARGSGDERTTEQLLLRSLEVAETAGAAGWSLRTALSLARLHRDAGREHEAAQVLAPAIGRIVDGAGTKDFDEAMELLPRLTHCQSNDVLPGQFHTDFMVVQGAT
jgi:hypothetical protein